MDHEVTSPDEEKKVRGKTKPQMMKEVSQKHLEPAFSLLNKLVVDPNRG